MQVRRRPPGAPRLGWCRIRHGVRFRSVMPWDFKSTPIVIICRDRLDPLRQLLDWLAKSGYTRPILVDNASTFPPLVDFLDQSSEVEVVRLNRNLGHLAPWTADEVQVRLQPSNPFVVTDCDVVPDDDCPVDVVEYLAGILLRYAGIDKVGLGLRIDDLPDYYALKQDVIAWESRFWELEIAPGLFDAEVDTTFALYRSPAVPHSTARALRTGIPYVAHHLSWYADSAHPTEEQQYYRQHVDPSASHWEATSTGDKLQTLLQRRGEEIATREIVTGSDSSLLRAWLDEPPLGDETAYTPWATPGWLAWNDMSPELEFCEFVGALMRLLQPAQVIETGVGQGFVTRRIAAWLGPDQQLLAFEDDVEIRCQLKRLPFFAAVNCSLGASPSPTVEDFARADLTVLDSEVPARLEELDRWIAAAPPGAVLIIHGTGDGHGPETVRRLIRRRVEEGGVDGAFLQNPRGGFFGVKPLECNAPSRPGEQEHELEKERALRVRAERELGELRVTYAYRLVRVERRLRESRWLSSVLRPLLSRRSGPPG